MKRVLTALILLPLTIYVILFLDPLYYGLIVTGVFLIAAYEWSFIVQISTIYRNIFFGFLLFLQLFFWFNFYTAFISHTIIFFSLLFWLYALYQVLKYPDKKFFLNNSGMKSFAGLMVLFPSWLSLILLRNESISIGQNINVDGGMIILSLMMLVWIADTGAYFSGKKWGMNKLLPKVSPGKTTEGVIGALALTVLATLVILLLLEFSWQQAIISIFAVSFLVCISVVGDLYESMFKRESGVKDSGYIIPGHGGILDRIDSLTAVAPFYFIFIHYGFIL